MFPHIHTIKLGILIRFFFFVYRHLLADCMNAGLRHIKQLLL